MAIHRINQSKIAPRRKAMSIPVPDVDSPSIQNPYQLNVRSSYLLSAAPVRLSMFCVEDCFALRLAQFLIDVINSRPFPLNPDGRFQDSFYHHCMSELEKTTLVSEIDDAELLIIYMKQIIIVMRAAGILCNEEGMAGITDSVPSTPSLYAKLFTAFWNDVEWDEIFTSSGELARELKKSRYILMDLTLKRPSAAFIEDLANDFFEMTGLSRCGDLFSISFLDFYFFTWLKHFGIIHYQSSGDFAPVSIEVTEKGRLIMKAAV